MKAKGKGGRQGEIRKEALNTRPACQNARNENSLFGITPPIERQSPDKISSGFLCACRLECAPAKIQQPRQAQQWKRSRWPSACAKD